MIRTSRLHSSLKEKVSSRAAPPEERFWNFVELIPFHSCWEWVGCKNKWGYGAFNPGPKSKIGTQAHRFSYTRFKGEIPIGLVLDHLCKNRACVNPEHLQPVSQRENVLRSDSIIGKPVTKCNRGHEYNKKTTYLYRGCKHCKICKVLRLREWRKKQAATPKNRMKDVGFEVKKV